MIDHRGLTLENVEAAVVSYLTSHPDFMGGVKAAEDLFRDWCIEWMPPEIDCSDVFEDGFNVGFDEGYSVGKEVLP